MSLSPYRPVPRWQRVLRSSAVGVSVGFHVVVALFLLTSPTAAKQASQWVEVAINEVKPPPPPPPPAPEPPPPEPPKKKIPPKVVKFEDTTPNPPPEAAPPPPTPTPRRIVRPIQGLTANSFAPGSGSGLAVRAGNTAAAAAGKETMSLADASGPFEARPYSSVTTAPHLRWSPTLDVPEEARKAHVNGRIDVRLDIDAKGRVVRVQVTKGLGYGTDEPCIDAWKKSQWKPAEQDGVPVAVLGVPEACAVNEGS
jgi:protein TonB